MLNFSPAPPTAAVVPPKRTPNEFFDQQTVELAKNMADLAAGQEARRPDQKGMPTGALRAPMDAGELATHGDAVQSAIGRQLPAHEQVFEHPAQQATRIQGLHQRDNAMELTDNTVTRGRDFMWNTAPAVLAQSGGDQVRQMESIQNQQLRGDRTPVAPPSTQALEYAVKEIYRPLQSRIRPNVM